MTEPAGVFISYRHADTDYPASWLDHFLTARFGRDNHVASDEDPWTWAPFWGELSALPGYDQVTEPRKLLRDACHGEPGIEQLSIFELPPRQWQLGTMFFVAESITSDPAEFQAATRGFLGALEPGAPFAAAFMAGSTGYQVGGTAYPATPVTLADVTACLTPIASSLDVAAIATAPMVRPGYTGMIVATGFASGP